MNFNNKTNKKKIKNKIETVNIINELNIVNNNKSYLNYFLFRFSFILSFKANIYIYYNKLIFNNILLIIKKIT